MNHNIVSDGLEPVRRVFCLFAILAVLATTLLDTSGARAASPIYVRPGGDDTNCNGTVNVDYSSGVAPNCAVKTIEKGITLVDAGGTVTVGAGTFTPAGGRLIINKSIIVQADPALTTKPKINTGYTSWTDCAIQIAAAAVVLQGFEIDNSAVDSSHLKGYIVGDYGSAKNGWTIRNNDIHNGRNAIRPVGNNVTIEQNNLHETASDLINCEYGTCYGLKVRYNWLHSHHADLGGKPAGLTYNVSSTPGADVEVIYNYAWANRTFVDFQTNGGLAPANHILIAHNTVDFWMDNLPSPLTTQNGEVMSIAWWMPAATPQVNFWNGPNFTIRDNLFTRQKWYAVVNTDDNNFIQGQLVLQNNMFWQWYLRDSYYPGNAYPNEWPSTRGAVGWANPYLGTGNGFVMNGDRTLDPLYLATGTTPDRYYSLNSGSPALGTATDGLNIGAWQGNPTAVTLSSFTARSDSPMPNVFDIAGLVRIVGTGVAVAGLMRTRRGKQRNPH